MGEFAPWALGLLLGVAYPRPLGSWFRAIPFIALLAACGTGITVLSGEWAQEPGFAIVDIGQVALAASIAAFVRGLLQLKWNAASVHSTHH
jgi:hypothetical protein